VSSITNRAQPDVAALPDNVARFPKPERAKVSGQIVRMPAWLRDLIREAADTEGLSQNAWISRVLAETAKLSAEDGWRSIPANDPPRRAEPVTHEPPSRDPYQPLRFPPATRPTSPTILPQPNQTQPWIGPIWTTGTGSTTSPGSGTSTFTTAGGIVSNSGPVSVSLHTSDPAETVDLTEHVTALDITTVSDSHRTYASGGPSPWPDEDIPDLS
jgi:hypothetical protein